MLKEKLMSAAGACVLVAGMAAVSEDVRAFVTNPFDGDPSTQLSLAGSGALRIANVMPDTLAFYAADHMALVFFGLGAIVLLGLMMRT
jgi:hypothetical protein